MKRLKLFFACLLMAVLCIGQMWATDVTYTFTSKSWADASGAWTGGGDGNGFTSGQGIQVTTGTTGANATSNSSFSNVSKVVVTYNTNKSKGAGSIAIKIGTNDEVSNSVAYSGSADGTSANFTTQFDFSPVQTGAIKITTNTTTNSIWVKSITITYSDGGTPDPTVSADPEEVEDVPVAGVTNQTIDLTYENITDYETEVSVHPNADGTGTLSPAWLTASFTDADDYATVTYSVSANEGAARTAYIKVYTTDGDKEATTIIPVSQLKYSAPTGTFELFSGDLTEGDYVICSGTTALKNALATNTNYIGYETVTVSEGIITNPLEELVWHIAASGDYWTIYNAAATNYAASTGAKNRGQVLTDISGDNADKALWTTSGSSTYEFVNKANTTGSVNANLRYNSGYGFACYSTSTGAALTLYKKQVAGQPATPEFSVAGGNYESAQSVEISCETVGAKIYYTLDGSKPSSTSTEYSTAIPVSATTTIKAVAIKDDIESTVASATYTIVVWQTVADVWDDITSSGPTNAHIYGYVSQTNVGGYANNFYISDNGSTEGNQLYAYRMDMNSYSVEKGDKVKLAGDLTLYNDVKEFKYTSADNCGKVIALEAKGDLQSVAVSGTPTKTEYAANEDFDPAGLKVFGTYANGFVGEITEGITWGNDLTDGKVTENTTVHVTATVSGITNDPAYDVPVTVAVKTLVSIAVGTASYTIYTGEALPQPVVTATFSEGEPENVSAFAVYDTESVFDTEVIDNPNPQTITVSYTFGGETKTTTYTVSVQDYENANDAPYSVTEALHIITAAIGNVESAREIVVTGTVSVENISGNKNRYKISDGVNELLVYAGKGFNNETFTNTNYPKVGDVVIVKGKVINFQGNTPEFASGKSYLLSQVRTATLAIEDVASLEVGADDLAEGDLVITTPSDGDITFVSGDDAVATIEANAIHAVAPGTVTITANLAATENVDALNYAATSTTFSVTVVAPATKYAITFDGNGADGGDAPDAIADKAAGAEVTLPANSYTKTGYVFDGWKVYDENQDEVTVTAGAFEMPASAVVIKAQWAEISVWATTYTSNLADVNNGGSIVKFYGEDTEYKAIKAGSGKAAGSTTITVPAQASKLHFHAYGWNGESVTLSITAPAGVTVSPASQAISANTGISGSTSTYTLAEGSTPETDAYFAVNLSGNNDEIELTISATSGNRFVLFGVNQEGGVLPILDHIAITGTMTNTTGWKTGDEITPEGLTVNAYYTLNEVMQDPVNVTNDPALVWSHAALVEDQTEVTLTATYTDGVAKSANVNVTIEAVETGDPTIITDPASYLNFGASVEKDAVVAPKTITVTLKNIAGATATLGGTNFSAFSIDDTEIVDGDVITVSVNTGTPGVYAGTVTIKDNDSETEKVINLSMTVVEPETPEIAVSTTSKWVVATAADLVDGAEVLITGVKDDVTYAMGGQNKNNRAAVAASVDGEDVLTPGENTMSFTLVAQETEGVFALRTSNGKYLYAAASGDNHMKTQGNVDANAQWTISATSAVAESSSNRNVMQFNGGSSLFSCYNTASQSAIQFYVPKQDTPAPSTPDYTRTVEINRYGTICLPNGGTISGATLFDLDYYDGANTLYLLQVNGNAMVAGRPYIFLPSATTIEVFYTDDAGASAGSFNGLVGSYTEETVAIGTGDEANYILYQNAYYLVNGPAKVGANRAYIHMAGVPTEPATPQVGQAPRRRVAMTVHGEQTATGCENINASETPVKMIIDGQLYILRGEKMYDATGKLVK